MSMLHPKSLGKLWWDYSIQKYSPCRDLGVLCHNQVRYEWHEQNQSYGHPLIPETKMSSKWPRSFLVSPHCWCSYNCSDFDSYPVHRTQVLWPFRERSWNKMSRQSLDFLAYFLPHPKNLFVLEKEIFHPLTWMMESFPRRRKVIWFPKSCE